MLGIYVRLSQVDDSSNSIDNQLRQGVEFAKSNNFEYKIYNEGQGLSGGFMAMFGGKSTIYTELCENSREEALKLMISNAESLGANAIINMRYESNEVMQGLTEVLAYGTAVIVEEN